MKHNIFWFRRDLRFTDNTGLFHALSSEHPVLPIFIFDPNILGKLEDKNDRRVGFIHWRIEYMKKHLQKEGKDFLVFYDDPLKVFKTLSGEFSIETVFVNHDYEPKAIARDLKVQEFLKSKSIEFKTFKDQVVFEKSEVVKDDGEPYSVFTPYSRKWLALYQDRRPQIRKSESLLKKFGSGFDLEMPTLKEMGFESAQAENVNHNISEDRIKKYKDQRDIPGLAGTTRVGTALRFGTLSPRILADMASKMKGAGAETWLKELIWREFFMQILWHHPRTEIKAFRPEYDEIEWRTDEKDFEKWKNGQTGYPIVDAGMRELNTTGFMHNRVRMVTASFLCKHLLLPWQWGERYFARKLLDYDLSSNVGNWQWAAGTGCDAAPYFRIFNPDSQTKRFDPEHEYIKTWVPEYESENYPAPMVDHKEARDRALRIYKVGLKKT